jgi:uncharacterized protein (DUF433 family)
MVLQLKLEPVKSELLSRITVDPDVCHGKPCIRGMRWPVVALLDLIYSDMTKAEILDDHPELEGEDLDAAIAFSKWMTDSKQVG